MGSPPPKRKKLKSASLIPGFTWGTTGSMLTKLGKPFYYLLFYSVLFTIIGLAFVTALIEDLVSRVTDINIPKVKFPRISVPLSFSKPKVVSYKSAAKVLRAVKTLLATMLLIQSVAIVFFLFVVLRDLPSPQELITRNQNISTKIFDRNGKLLFTIYKDQNRTPIPLADIPLEVRLATLAAEDAEFYHHPGFSLKGISRAAIVNTTKGELTGGSTITQQLVKNALLSSEKTFVRKVRELVLSVEVEMEYSKDEILEMYLNEVSYGGTAYGIHEAAMVYFGKDVTELSLAEAALLAGLPKSPTRFSPFGANPEYAKSRQWDVLNLMKINGYINENQMQKALDQELVYADSRVNIEAPHFVMYVKKLLVDKYGEEVVEKGGLSVITSLDINIQKQAEETVASEMENLKRLNVGNAAALVLDPSSGEILAMVGSKDYFDSSSDGNVNITTSLRQPGSSIKVVNYAYALSNGFSPATVIADTPVSFDLPAQPPYRPKNYDGGFRGNISLRSALAESRNVPAVKILATYGVDKMIETGRKMGISSWEDPSRFGLSLTLGAGEVTLTDLATVYATLANYGEKPTLKPILQVANHDGKILEEHNCSEVKSSIATKFINDAQAAKRDGGDCKNEKVLDERVAFMLTDILKDNNARSPAFGSHSLLNVPGHPEVAVKTGTSNNLRDNLAIGYTQDYVVAVWVGNNDNSPMSRVASGVTGATPIWNKIISGLLADTSVKEWRVPEGIVRQPTCTYSGKTVFRKEEWFLVESAEKNNCPYGYFANSNKEDENATKKRRGDILNNGAATRI